MTEFTKVKHVEMHKGFFLSGVNLPPKLPGDRRDLEIKFEEEKRRMWVTLKGETMKIPEVNCVGWIEDQTPAPKLKDDKPQLPKLKERPSAQVSTPQSHVFAGPGAGKVGK